MSEFITLACPSCGGKLQITNDIERFVCAHCGTEMFVRRGEGIISLRPVIEEVKGVRRATDHTAAELAMVRIQKEIDELIMYRDSTPIDNDTGCIRGLALIILISIVISCCATANSNDLPTLYIIPILLTIGFFVIVIIIKNRGTKSDERRNARQAEVNLRIAQKQNELDKYRNIVNSN